MLWFYLHRIHNHMLNIITLPYQALGCLEMLCTCQCRHCLPFKCNFSIFCSLNMRKTCLLCRVHEYVCILNCDAYLRRSVLHLENTSRQSRTSLHIHPSIHRWPITPCALADKLWAPPPPTFVIKKGQQKICRIERNFFENLWKRIFSSQTPRQKLTGAPPPTQWHRRTTLSIALSLQVQAKCLQGLHYMPTRQFPANSSRLDLTPIRGVICRGTLEGFDRPFCTVRPCIYILDPPTFWGKSHSDRNSIISSA